MLEGFARGWARRRRSASIVAWAAVAALCVTGCESGGSVGDEPVSRCVPEGSCGEAMFRAGLTAAQGTASAGATLFATHCTECHGVAGVGVREAHKIDMTSTAWQARVGDADIVRTLRSGRPPVMPAFRFSEGELRELLALVRTLPVAPAPDSKPTGGY